MTKKMVLLWVCSLVVVAALTSTLTVAQVVGERDVTPRVMSGADVGFRVEALRGREGVPTGSLVIQVNGEWVEVSLRGGAARPLR